MPNFQSLQTWTQRYARSVTFPNGLLTDVAQVRCYSRNGELHAWQPESLGLGDTIYTYRPCRESGMNGHITVVLIPGGIRLEKVLTRPTY